MLLHAVGEERGEPNSRLGRIRVDLGDTRNRNRILISLDSFVDSGGGEGCYCWLNYEFRASEFCWRIEGGWGKMRDDGGLLYNSLPERHG